jgi:4-hydroxybenzoate polyprenyltransferase
MRSPEQRATTSAPDQDARDARPVAPSATTTRALALLRLMRPQQWVKNLLVYLALVFARRVTDLPAVGRVTLAFFAFCLAASAIYILNDLMDRERDRSHPRKRSRPLASGLVTPRQAMALMAACLAGAGALTVWLAIRIPLAGDPFARWGGSAALFTLCVVGYVGVNVLYSLWLKHVVLIDIFLIAAGYVLRALAGAFVIPVPISPWFYLCITFGALFLALGKRRAELLLLSDDAFNHRRNLREYTLPLLDQLIIIVVTCTLISYSLYTFQGENASHDLMLTIPLVVFGLFRYLYLIYVKAAGDRPDELLWRDRQIFATIALWFGLTLALLYLTPRL